VELSFYRSHVLAATHPAVSVNALKETQSTHQWPDLVLSSSTSGILMEGCCFLYVSCPSSNSGKLSATKTSRHSASTGMHSLTFRVRVTTPPQYGRSGTAHTAGASMLSLVRGVFAGMRAVGLADYRWLCHAFLMLP